jgi:asparagine synthase (glutamine-hydrolysing)
LANFVVVVDADAERRALFIRTIQPRMVLVDGLQLGSCSQGDFSSLWAAAPGAPISQVADSEGAAVLWGEAIPGPGPERIDAARLREQWQGVKENPPEAYDGFYAGVVQDRQRGLIVGADLLGLFPVYYCAVRGGVLIGSSPELFRHHPEFRMELNPAGLVGILLTNGLVGGQTLLKGVQRLSPGHLLVWRAGSSPREVRQYQIPVSTRYFDLPFGAHVEILDQAVKAAIHRHVSGGKRYGLLLSGGLDSRLLGGYLREQGTETVALTLGLPTDIEMQCAIPVARTLGFQHRTAEIASDLYAQNAPLCAAWEHLAAGFNGVIWWGLRNDLRDLKSDVVSGVALDSALAPHLLYGGGSAESRGVSFRKVLDSYNRWGIRADLLERLLRREVFKDLVPETIAQVQAIYESYSDLDSKRAWCFQLHHRARLHTGSMAWHFSLGAWPVLPVLDRQLLASAGGMPIATIGERRAENELLCKKFPKLAALTLDRNTYDTQPLKPRIRYLLASYLSHRLTVFRRRLFPERKQNVERRYYYRTYDFNSPGWVAVRKVAEPHRARTFDFFERNFLQELLPGPDASLRFQDGIIDASGLKMLTGFFLWSKDHV